MSPGRPWIGPGAPRLGRARAPRPTVANTGRSRSDRGSRAPFLVTAREWFSRSRPPGGPLSRSTRERRPAPSLCRRLSKAATDRDRSMSPSWPLMEYRHGGRKLSRPRHRAGGEVRPCPSELHRLAREHARGPGARVRELLVFSPGSRYFNVSTSHADRCRVGGRGTQQGLTRKSRRPRSTGSS